MKKKISLVVVVMIVIAALSRLIPHPPNVTPLAAMGLFGAFYIKRKWLTYIVLFAALFMSDLILNNFIYGGGYASGQGFVWLSKYSIAVYIGFFAMIAFAKFYLKTLSANSLIKTTLIISLIFFLITNFGAWMLDPMYPKSIAGLITCYIAGIPFFAYSIGGNLFFVGVLFGSYQYLQKFDTQIA